MTLERAAFEHRLPHTGTMCLIDPVLVWDDQRIRGSASSHRDPGNPLAEEGRLHAVCGVEYAAQAVALHAALAAPANHTQEPIPGYLAGIRRLDMTGSRLEAIVDDLLIKAERQLADCCGLVYDFSITAGGHRLLGGTLSILFAGVAEPTWPQ